VRLRMPFGRRPKEFPDHLWTKCPNCGEMLFNKQLARNQNVCTKCEYHFRLGARERIEALVDKGTFVEKDAAIAGSTSIGGNPVELVVMNFEFMGGSMGSVVGEKITRAAERALIERRALVMVSASGGARMQEGTLALMQMGKIVSALARLDEAGVPFVSIITDPTTGGVLASYASLGDLIVAEPGALIRFSGERVTSGTVGEKLPVGFGRSEFLLEKGFLDQIVPRPQLRERLTFFLTSFRAASQDMRWSL